VELSRRAPKLLVMAMNGAVFARASAECVVMERRPEVSVALPVHHSSSRMQHAAKQLSDSVSNAFWDVS